MTVDTTKKTSASLNDVFYESKKRPHSHFPRQEIDDKFFRSKSEGKSILVYGGPYTGKTSLVSNSFEDHEFIRIDCFEDMTIDKVYAQILKDIGYRIEAEASATTGSNAQITANIAVSCAGVDMGLEGTTAREETTSIRMIQLELCLSNPHDIIRALHKMDFDKYIVLEWFHYLKPEVQQTFVTHLKAFLEHNIKLVILYTAVEPSLFQEYIDEKPHQFIALNMDKWSDSDLRRYIAYCSEWLNIRFTDEFVDKVLYYASGHFGIVRKACCTACQNEGIHQTQRTLLSVGARQDVKAIIKGILQKRPESYAYCKELFRKIIQTDPESFLNYLDRFAKGLRTVGINQYYKWILYCVITATPGELKSGIPQKTIIEKIKSRHPKKNTKTSSIIASLTKIQILQREKCDSLMLMEYLEDHEGNKKLKIRDTDFMLWLFIQDRVELLQRLELPTD